MLFGRYVVSDPFHDPMECSHQAPLSIKFPRQKYWSGFPVPSPGDLPDPRIKLLSPALVGRSLLLSHQGNCLMRYTLLICIWDMSGFFWHFQNKNFSWSFIQKALSNWRVMSSKTQKPKTSNEEGAIILVKWTENLSVVADSLRPYGLYSPWNSPGQNTGVGRLSLLQGIFPTQGLNPGLPHCRRILYQLSHQGSPLLYFPPLIT